MHKGIKDKGSHGKEKEQSLSRVSSKHNVPSIFDALIK